MTQKGTHNEIIEVSIKKGLRLDEQGRVVLPSGRLHRGTARPGTYHRVTLYHNGLKVGATRGRIVCWLTYGPPPTDQHVCDHINHDVHDDSPGNLRWATLSENTRNITSETRRFHRDRMQKQYAEGKRRIEAHDQLVDALKGVVGLVQLLTSREDLRKERSAILSNHRYLEAEEALKKWSTPTNGASRQAVLIHTGSNL